MSEPCSAQLILRQFLILSPDHCEALARRGLAITEDSNPNGYRTLGKDRRLAAQRLWEDGFEQLLPSVPGFVLQEPEDGQSYWSLTGRHGILLPVRDAQTRIVALKVRANDDQEPKYAYLSCGSLVPGVVFGKGACG